MKPDSRNSRQHGYILLALIFVVAMMAIAAAALAPQIGQQIRREREEELIRRGQQYARAVQLYFRKFGRFPARLEDLENTNNIRFLRRRYLDPMTAKGEWRIIHFGQAKTTPRGFGAASGPGTPAAALGRQPSAQPGAQQPGARQAGTPAGQISRPAGTGQTFGGAGVIGVASTSEKRSIKEIHGKSQYNEWEFIYDPRFDPVLQQRPPGAPAGPQQPGSQPQPGRPGQQPGPQPGSQPGSQPGPQSPQRPQ